MKLFYKSLLVCFILVGLISCNDEPIGESYGEEIPANAAFKVDINGETFFANISGVLTQDSITQIVGKRHNGTRVSIKIAGAGTGTYVLNGTPEGTAFYYDSVAEPYTMENIDTVGVLEITKYDIVNGLASGTFSFKAHREASSTTTTDTTGSDSTQVIPGGTLVFTNGEFTNIPLRTDLAPPPGSLSNFHVTLNDSLYEASNIQAISIADSLIISTTKNGQSLQLTINQPAVGTFTLGSPSTAEALILFDPNTGDDTNPLYTATDGVVIITEFDAATHTLTGTFTGTLANSANPEEVINMTTGVFTQINFTEQVEVPAPMSAMIDNVLFEAEGNLVTADLGNSMLSITGTDANGNSLQLNIPSSPNTGSYNVTVNAAYSAIYTTADTTTYHTVANSGHIAIDTNDGSTLEGSFTFSVRDSLSGDIKQFNQGYFKIML